MRILLLGNNGQLGWEIGRALARIRLASDKGPSGPSAVSLTSLDYPVVDLADEHGLRRVVKKAAGRHEEAAGCFLIINAAAYTAVDRAEREPGLAMAVNGLAPGILAEEARALGAGLIHFSTDYVFDGEMHEGNEAFVETDRPNPLNVYGKTKLAGEQAVEQVGGTYLILRTAWLYGLRQTESSFVAKVLRWAREKEILRIVSDQVSSPTWARALAEATVRVIEMAMTEGARPGSRQPNARSEVIRIDQTDPDASIRWLEDRAGLYHLAGDGSASRYDWARAVLEFDPKGSEQKFREILPAQTADFPTPAKRPLLSALDCGKFERTFGFKLPPWRDSLREALKSKESQEKARRR